MENKSLKAQFVMYGDVLLADESWFMRGLLRDNQNHRLISVEQNVKHVYARDGAEASHENAGERFFDDIDKQPDFNGPVLNTENENLVEYVEKMNIRLAGKAFLVTGRRSDANNPIQGVMLRELDENRELRKNGLIVSFLQNAGNPLDIPQRPVNYVRVIGRKDPLPGGQYGPFEPNHTSLS